MPWYSPWYKKYRERFEGLLPRICLLLVLFSSVFSIYSLSAAKWPAVRDLRLNLILVLIGFLFILLGNLLPRVPKNFFIGIRTPWSLADEVIWEKTHRLGGQLFVLGGLVLLLKGFVLIGNSAFQIITAVIALALFLYPLLHSFIVYRRLRGE
ncbi:MAG: SdpI family protein, partial [Candidatus Syntrophosphaera sp.]